MARTKMDIDKERMYSKIMPSSARARAAEPEPEPPSAPAPIVTPVFTPQGPETDPQRPGEGGQVSQGPTAPEVTKLLDPVRRSSQNFRSGLKLMETSSTFIFNVTEQLVSDKLEMAFAKFNCCKCDRCKKDVVAIALNKLKPRYIVLGAEDPIPEPDRQTTADVTTALIQAIITVKNNPRH